MSSQIRSAGMGGFTGFDYNALTFVLRAQDVPEAKWAYVLEKLDLLARIAAKYLNTKDEGS